MCHRLAPLAVFATYRSDSAALLTREASPFTTDRLDRATLLAHLGTLQDKPPAT
ncbi:hypothetical protein [Micromonospora profundi]|uniref:hypothetical protein n=1 Tax=Micromonospora profundi TaxID=1420889 RepID=UPI00380E4808